MDADLQDDPHEIPNLIKKIDEGYDLVSGWKKIRFDPFIKKYSSRLFNFVTSLLTGIKIHDFNCGLKIYRREVTQSIKVYGEMHRYLPVLAHWNGFRVGEIVVRHHPRRYGKTKFGASRFLKGFLDLITILFTTRYLRRPLHFFGTLGFLLFVVGFAIDLYLAIEWAFLGKYLTNRPMLWLGILLILLGVQTIAIGLIGEMIAHHAQKVEDYHIKVLKL
jgi:Glycosyl transferase family 2.